MKMKLRWSGLVASVVLSSMAVTAMAQDAGSIRRVDLNLKDAELLSALQALALQSGLEFSIQVADTDKIRRITVKIKDRTAEEAIRYICEAAGVTVEKDETGVFIVRTATAAAVTPISSAPKKQVLRKIALMKGDPNVVYRRVLFGDVVDPAEEQMDLRNLREAMSTKASYQNAPTITDVSTLSRGVPTPIRSDMGVNKETIQIPQEAANQRGGGGGGGLAGGGGFGQPGGGGGGGFGQPGGGGGAGGAGGGLGLQGGQGFVPEGISRFSYDPVDNSIVVQGSEEAIRELERIIEQFDVAPKQVKIDVKYITTSNSRDKSLGMDWLYQRGGVFAGNRPGSFARTNDPIFINYATGNITTRLRTLLSDGWGRVVNNPNVTTMNNQPAFFQATTITTVFINQVVTSNTGIVLSPTPTPISVNNSLSVRPRINNDGTVSMIVSTGLGDFGQLRRGPDGSEIPDQLIQSVQVAVRVKSGETVALGGLTRKTDNYSRSRIPVLSDLPIIGQLFQGRNEQTSTQDLTIFLTPTILDEANDGFIP